MFLDLSRVPCSAVYEDGVDAIIIIDEPIVHDAFAGEQIASRRAVAIRHAEQRHEAAHAKPPPHLGETTPPDYRYTGPGDRVNPDDPHQACYAVVQVERLLADHPEWRLAFEQIYIDQGWPGLFRHAEYEMAMELAERLGRADEDKSVVEAAASEILAEARRVAMERRRQYLTAYAARRRQGD